MAVVKNLMVRAGADFSAITKQANKASQSMKGMQSSVSRSCGLMTKAVGGLKKILGAVGAAFAASSFFSRAKDAATAYDKQAQNEVRLATVMRQTMSASNAEIQSIMDLTAAEQKLGVVGDEVQLAGAQQLSTYLHLSSSLQTLIPVMNDLAVQQYGMNVSEEQAVSIAKLFGKALGGQTSALTRYGFTISAAQEKVLKYGTEEDRVAALTDIVTGKVGGMNAALADTPTGRMQQLQNTLGDIQEKFGQAIRTIGTVFLPVLNAVGDALTWIANMANKVAQTIANVFGGTAAGNEWKWSGVSAGISDAADAMDDLTDAQDSSANAAKKQREALQTASFDTLNILKSANDAASSSGDSGYSSGNWSNPVAEISKNAETTSGLPWLQEKLEKLKTGLEKLKERWDDFKSGLDLSNLKTAWDALWESLKNFGSTVSEILGPLWDRYLKPLAQWTINEALPWLLEKTAKGFEIAAKFIRVSADVAYEFGTEIGRTLVAAREFGRSIGSKLANVYEASRGFAQKIKDVWTNTTGTIRDTTYKTKDAVKTAMTMMGSWATGFGERIKNAYDKAVNGIGDGISKAKESVSQGLQKVAAILQNVGQKILDGFVQPFQKAYDLISGIVDKIKSLLNFKWNIPKPKVPQIKWNYQSMRVGNSSIQIPQFSVEWYAKGGVFDRASLIGVGENGKEAVVPLERNTGWISKIASELAAQMYGSAATLGGEALIDGIHDAVYDAMMSAMGLQSRGGSHTTIWNVNGREFFRATWDDFKAVMRERGVSLVNT